MIRRMRWWDLDAVVALEGELFDDAWSEELFWDELAQGPSRTYVVAEEDEEIVGYAGLAAMPDEGYVQTLAVAPSRQRHGLGAALLTHLMDDAKRRGLPRMGLEVRIDNEPAIRLYERHGFEAIAVRKRYYQPSGTDALVMVTT